MIALPLTQNVAKALIASISVVTHLQDNEGWHSHLERLLFIPDICLLLCTMGCWRNQPKHCAIQDLVLDPTLALLCHTLITSPLNILTLPQASRRPRRIVAHVPTTRTRYVLRSG